MGRIVRVEDRPRLTGSLTDLSILRADGTTGAVEGSGWYISDGAILSSVGGQIASSGASVDLTIGSERDLVMGGDRNASLTSDGVTTISGNTSLALSAAAVTVTGNTTITGDDAAAIDVGGASNVTIEAPAGTIDLAAPDYSVSNAANFRAAIGVGAPCHRVKAPAGAQNITSAANVTFSTSGTTSADVSYTGNEFIINTAGTYEISVSLRITNGSSSQIQCWLTDDVATQGTDVEVPGSRRSSTPGALTTHHTMAIVSGLVANDTLRVVAERVTGAATCTIEEGSATVRRIA